MFNSLQQVVLIVISWIIFTRLYKNFNLLSYLKKHIKIKSNIGWISLICAFYLVFSVILGALMSYIKVPTQYILITSNIFMGFFLSLLSAQTFKNTTSN